MSLNVIPPPAIAQKPLRIFAFYTDFPAGVHAKALADSISRHLGAEVNASLEIWKLDSIPPVGPLKNMIVNDAREADVWIIASSAPGQWDALIMEWMNCLHAKEVPGKVPELQIGLLGNSTIATPGGNFKWLLDLLALLAQQKGQQFVWGTIDHDSARNLDWLAEPIRKLKARRTIPPLPLLELRHTPHSAPTLEPAAA